MDKLKEQKSIYANSNIPDFEDGSLDISEIEYLNKELYEANGNIKYNTFIDETTTKINEIISWINNHQIQHDLDEEDTDI